MFQSPIISSGDSRGDLYLRYYHMLEDSRIPIKKKLKEFIYRYYYYYFFNDGKPFKTGHFVFRVPTYVRQTLNSYKAPLLHESGKTLTYKLVI